MSKSKSSTLDSILSSTLCCTNCEDATPKIEVWCTECFHTQSAAEENRTTPVALCKQCNQGLHTPAKMSLHRRQPFRCNTERMPSAAEMKFEGGVYPASMPSLCSLMCSNCEVLLTDALSPQWCAECLLILCKDCSRDLHAPQKKKVHQRYPFKYRFISAHHLADENGTIEEASNLRTGTANSSLSLSSSGSVPTLVLNTSYVSNGVVQPSPTGLSTRSTMPHQSALPSALMKKKSLANSAGVGSSKVRNSGQPGDVYQLGEPSLTGEMESTLLSFKNTYNDFDRFGLVQIVQICCGNKHAGGVTAGGSLFMWGQNSNYECGFNSGEEKILTEPTIVQLPPSHAGDIPSVRMIACGFEHSVCITHTNHAYSWGSGLMGILGHESDINRESPTLINLHWNNDTKADSKEELVYVACGPQNTGIVVRGRSDGKQIYTFGGGEYGTLGTGKKLPSLQPQLIYVEEKGGSSSAEKYPEISSLCFGTNHAVAVTRQGSVFSWGSNRFGQCGYILEGNQGTPATTPKDGGNSYSNAINAATAASTGAPPHIPRMEKHPSVSADDSLQLIPRLVDSLRTQKIFVKQAACGELSTSVLTDTGAIYSWGSGETHQLGIMDNVDQFLPVRASVLGSGGGDPAYKAVSLAVGVSSCAAVTETGDVFVWGWSVETPIPTLVPHLRSNHMQSISIGAHDNVACLTGMSNEVYQWRFTDEGDEPDLQAETEPKQNRALRGKRLTSISVGKGRCAASTAAGVLLEWGVDTQRDPSSSSSSSSSSSNGTALAAASSSSTDTDFDPLLPHEIRCAWSIKEVMCSSEHSVALTMDGKVLTWGTGGMGRLGQVTDNDYSSPTMIPTLQNEFCTSIGIGPGNTGCTTREFKAYVWGAGNSGQMGTGDIHPIFQPAQIAALAHVDLIGLAFGNRHCILIGKQGEVYATGDNGFGQLGLGGSSESKYLKPQQVTSLKSVQMKEVSCGDNVTLLLSTDGRIFAFGAGETNQIPGHQEDVHTPIQIVIPFQTEPNDVPSRGTFIKEISVATINCCALADNGTVWHWGWSLGETISRVDYMVKESLNVKKVAMGPTYMLLGVEG